MTTTPPTTLETYRETRRGSRVLAFTLAVALVIASVAVAFDPLVRPLAGILFLPCAAGFAAWGVYLGRAARTVVLEVDGFTIGGRAGARARFSRTDSVFVLAPPDVSRVGLVLAAFLGALGAAVHVRSGWSVTVARRGRPPLELELDHFERPDELLAAFRRLAAPDAPSGAVSPGPGSGA